MTLYTADTPREWREKGGSLSKKLNTEFGLLETLLDSVSRTTDTLTITKATITLAGSTKINLDGPVDISGAIVCDAAAGIGISLTSNYTDAIKISGTTIADGLEIASSCGSHAINISGAQTGAGITLGSTCGTYGLNIAGACTTAGIFLSTTNKISFHDSGIYMRASADGHFEIVSDDTITLSSPGHGSIVFGGETDWGTGATGPDLDGTGWDWVTQTVGRVNTENITAAAYAGQYTALTVTKGQNLTSSFFANWNELYISDSSVMTGASNFASVWGQLELGATVTSTDNGDFMASIYANVKAGATFTNNTAVCGVRAQTEITSSGYSTGTYGRTSAFECLAGSGRDWDYGVYLNDYTTGIYFAETGAATEHLIDVVDAYLGMVIETGTYQSAVDGGITLSDTNTRPVSFLFDDSGSALTGNNRAVLSRVYLAESQAAGATIVSIQGQLKLADTKNLGAGRWSAMDAYLEFGGTSLLTTGGYTSALDVRIDVADTKTVTVDSGAILAGIHIQTTGTGTLTQTGNCYGIYINDQGTIDDWKVGISVNNSTTGIEIGGGTTGIDFGSSITGNCISVTDSVKFFNATVTPTGSTGVNCAELTCTEDLDHSSGYARGLYINYTHATNAITTTGEINLLGLDYSIQADVPYLYGITLYGAHSGNPLIGFAAPISIYQDDLGNQLGAYVGIDIGVALSNAPADRYSFMRFRDHSTAIPTSVFRFEGAHCASYLFDTTAGTGVPDFITGNSGQTPAADGIKIAVKYHGTTYYIKAASAWT